MTYLAIIAEMAGAALIAWLVVAIWLPAMRKGGGRVLFDVDHYHEGWPEIVILSALATILGISGFWHFWLWIGALAR